jgi:DNA-directed RNA polymerase subunit omega
MARVTIEDCLKKVDSRFSLVHLAVHRVLQLRAGAPPLVDAPKNKQIVVALREIAADRVTHENIQRLGETKSLPETTSKAKADATHREVEEIVEAATQYDASLEFTVTEPLIEPVEAEEE